MHDYDASNVLLNVGHSSVSFLPKKKKVCQFSGPRVCCSTEPECVCVCVWGGGGGGGGAPTLLPSQKNFPDHGCVALQNLKLCVCVCVCVWGGGGGVAPTLLPSKKKTGVSIFRTTCVLLYRTWSCVCDTAKWQLHYWGARSRIYKYNWYFVISFPPQKIFFITPLFKTS